MAKGRKTGGRKSAYTRELTDAICLRISEGEPLSQVMRDPEIAAQFSKAAFLAWVRDDVDGLADRYRNARNMMLDHFVDEMIEIADDGRNDWTERESRSGAVFKVVDREATERSKLRVATRQWQLSKLKPEQYGDRSKLEHSGSVDLNGLRNAIAGLGLQTAKARAAA